METGISNATATAEAAYTPGGTDVAVADGGTGSSTAAGARTNLGLGSIATQDSSNVTITGGSVTGITDVAVADGGTGSSTASGARTNLGLVIGTDVEAHDTDLTTIAGLTPTNDDVIQRKAGAWTNRSMSQLKTDLAVTGADLSMSDVTTNNVTSTKHGFAPKSPADATQFLNGATTPAWAQVKDSDLSLSDITTNNASTSNHGFLKKLDNNAAHYMDGTGAWSTPAGSGATFSGVKATASTNATITSGTWTSVNWDTEEFDTDSYHSTSSNTNRLTIGTGLGGKFLMIVSTNFTSNATGFRAMQVTKNTTTANTNLLLSTFTLASSGVGNTWTMSGVVSLADADWINVNVHQNSTTNLTWGSSVADLFWVLIRLSS